MQSIKNTTVSIVLLVLSYGVYQVITKPLPSEMENNMLGALEIIDSAPRSENSQIANLEMPSSGPFLNDVEDSIPPQLLNLETPSNSFDRDLESKNDHHGIEGQFAVGNRDDATATQNPKSAALAPSQRDFQSPSNQSIPTQSLPNESTSNQTVSFDSQNELLDEPSESNQQFDSDSQIIPSTVMASVSRKPVGTESQPLDAMEEKPRTLSDTWPLINEMIENSRFQDALNELSSFYRADNVTADEREQLLDWLDALAAKVIYSSEHHLRSVPYIIQPDDTIGSLARKWQVPAQLIYNINTQKIPNPNDLTPGVEIKLVQGPFDAEIDSQAGLMTLYLENMYAGRFSISPGQAVAPGEFRIVDKSAQDHLDRPFWIALNNGSSIYATDSDPLSQNEIGMKLREAEEIFSILSASSTIRVLR